MRLLFPLFLVLLAQLGHAAPVVRVAEIRGSINPATAGFLRSSIALAEREGAEALIVELDTPGGLLASVRDMAQAMDRSAVPVVVHVVPAGAAATSAGALLMLASHFAAMAPGTNIGAAHPVGPKGEDLPGALGEKAVNDTAAFARGLAEVHGRNRDLADAMVARSRSLSAREAFAQNLIEALAADRTELLARLEGKSVRMGQGGSRTLRVSGADIRRTEMTLGQKLLSLLADPNIAAILMSLGVLLIYVELSNPGITVAGVTGAICLLIALMSFQLLPIQTGGLLLVLFGILLMLAEPFVVSHGILAIGGVASFALGLLWLVDPSLSGTRVSLLVWIPIVVGLGSGVLLIGWAAARMRLLSRRTLERIGGGAVGGLAGYEGHVETVSSDGRAGKALFRGELWDFRSEMPVKRGDSIVAVRNEGFLIHIAPATPAPAPRER
ncbi:MAG: nodulation protein NfeD [Oligoflexia bacterium]|nr:nodulation protein NfeD [Oligoflexia bacterium]